MSHNYTRQRQGATGRYRRPERPVSRSETHERDFSILKALAAAEMSVEANYNNIDGVIGNSDKRDDYDEKKTMLEQLAYLQAVAERNAAPVDGKEPPERGL